VAPITTILIVLSFLAERELQNLPRRFHLRCEWLLFFDPREGAFASMGNVTIAIAKI
jgi:hypothetical protein